MVGFPGWEGLFCSGPATRVAARVDRGDHVIWVGVALRKSAVTVPGAFETGVVEAETWWVGLMITDVGTVLLVGVEADKSILVGRGVFNGGFGVDGSAGRGVAALGVDESTATGVFSTK